MGTRELNAIAIVVVDVGRVAVQFGSRLDVNLEFIYRAAQSVDWNESLNQLEDRYEREESRVESFRRIAGVLINEYGLQLRAVPEMRWEDKFTENEREEIERELLG
jgi:hypothetical protein